MPYRICKTIDIENGHMLSKHPDKCQFPHGHTRKVEFVLEAFESNWVAPVGPQLDAFEQEFAAAVGSRHAVGVTSGTAALHSSLASGHRV